MIIISRATHCPNKAFSTQRSIITPRLLRGPRGPAGRIFLSLLFLFRAPEICIEPRRTLTGSIGGVLDVRVRTGGWGLGHDRLLRKINARFLKWSRGV